MPTIRFTDAKVRGLVCPTDKPQIEYRDSRYPGLVLKVGRGGTKTWSYRQTSRTAAGRRPWLKLGRYPAVSYRDALDHYSDKDARVQNGKPPEELMERIRYHEAELCALRRQANLLSFEALVELYRTSAKVSKLKDPRQPLRILEADPLRVWSGRPAEEISKEDVKVLLEEVKVRVLAKRAPGDDSPPTMVNRVLIVTKTLFNWAVKEEHLKVNPAANIDLPIAEHERERWLDAREIRVYFRALETDEKIRPAVKDALRLALLTGQRRNEVAGIEWSELEIDDAGQSWWNLPAAKAKPKRPNRIFLAPQALEIIGRQRGASKTYVFHRTTSTQHPMRPDDLSEAFKRVTDALLTRKAIGRRATAHDLRRTANTHWASLGITRRFQKMMLNQGSRVVTDRYDRYDYASEVSDAWILWADRLDKILS